MWMTDQTQKFRLDEILTKHGLVSEDQVKVALDLQKIYGGRFGSLLLHKGFIDEAGLVKALSRQMGFNGVVISKLEIPDVIYRMIPKKVALARKVLPFDYDVENNTLKIACADPTDEGLLSELGFLVRGKKVELYVAADIALNAALSKYYLGKEVNFQDSIKLEIPAEQEKSDQSITAKNYQEQEQEQVLPADENENQPMILLVSDDTDSIPPLRTIFGRDNYGVIVTDSANDAIQMLGKHRFHMVFIKDTVPGDYIDLIERVRKLSPETNVRYFDTTTSLILQDRSLRSEGDLILKNLELFTSLLSSRSNYTYNHSGQVGQYAERLCRQLNIPDRDRLIITNAAYIHDLARFYYDTGKFEGNHQEIRHTVKLLTSIDYSPVVLEMLRSMYLDLKGKYTKRLPVEVLGGNILTIVDLFCDSIPQSDRLSIDRFESIKLKLNEMVGKLFLPEVAEAFINMVQNDILDRHSADTGQVMIFSEDHALVQPIELRLKNEGIRTISHHEKKLFLELYNRSRPDMMIVIEPGTPDKIIDLTGELTRDGIDFEQTPTFIVAEAVCLPRVTVLLERGIEDIIPISDNNEMLVSKVKKLHDRIEEGRKIEKEKKDIPANARGRLSDMNLIDLIQALGPSQKTVRITIRQNQSDSAALIIYLNQGKISYARYKELTGPEAVYEGLSWSDGHWIIEPLEPEALPEPNNSESNENILIQGCRRMDENQKAAKS